MLEELLLFLPLAERSEDSWLAPTSRDRPTRESQRDIDEVMLATSLVPDGYLSI